MRDKMYIVNLVHDLVGRSIIKGLTAEANSDFHFYHSPFYYTGLLSPQLIPKLCNMSVEKLGVIIEYSNLLFLEKHSDLLHQQHPFKMDASQEVRRNSNYGASWGKALLVHLALFTVLAITFDIVHQERYRRNERAIEEARRRFGNVVTTGVHTDGGSIGRY